MQCLLLGVNAEWEAAGIRCQDPILDRQLVWGQSLRNPPGNRMDQRPDRDETSVGEQHISFVSKMMQLTEHTISHTHTVHVVLGTVSQLSDTDCEQSCGSWAPGAWV